MTIRSHTFLDSLGTLASLWPRISGLLLSGDSDCAYLDEDDGRSDCQKAVELDKNVVLSLLRWAIKEHLLDALNSKLFVLEFDLIGLWAELLCKSQDLLRESCREE